jgi:hypothetical protein
MLSDDAHTSGSEPDRREFLKLCTLALGAAAIGPLAYCGRAARPADAHLPFTVWEEIREALRTSPDHLVARAGRLVAEADPASLFHFVRDQVATYPTSGGGIDGRRGVRWGTRGTLRGGAGTPREKAELLAELYRRAGLTAEVLEAPLPMPPEAVRGLLLRAPQRSFAPEISGRQLSTWRARLELPRAPEVRPLLIDEGGVASRELASRIERALPAQRPRPRDFDWRWQGAVPVVRVQHGDTTSYANLFSPGTPFGEAGIDPRRLRPAAPAAEAPMVEVTLSGALSSDPGAHHELATGRWSLEDLVGRQVIVQMLPGLDFRRQAVASFRDVRTFVPALAVQGFDLDRAAMEALSVVGDPISRGGDRIELSPTGSVSIDGRPLVSPDRPARSESIASLSMEVDSSRYPTIRLRASVTDAAGASVDGVAASGFRIEEEGTAAGFLLSANRAALRIAFLSDGSGSMPNAYRGAGMRALVASLSERIRAEHPNAEIRPVVTDSRLWEWLTRAASTDANLIIFATDGHVNGEPTDEMRSILAHGPPVVILNVNDYGEQNSWYQRTFVPMAAAANGTIVSVGRQTDAESAILAHLRSAAPQPVAYNFEYGAPADGAGRRRVVLATADGRVSATGSYDAPEAAPVRSEWCGLYLTVTIGRRSHTRTLAGHDPARHARMPATPGMLSETLGAFFGSHVLSFEAAAPSLSTWLDDFITAKLSLAPLDRALDMGADLATIEARVQEGMMFLPPELFLQATPLHEPVTDRSLTYENGPRVMLHQAYPVFDTDRLMRHFDILPFTTFATAAGSGEDAFRITMEKSARFAIAEASLYPTSTYSMLARASLLDHGTGAGEASPEQRALRGRLFRPFELRDHKLVAADGSTLAFWHVDHQSGSLLGILPDGSGGGTAEERMARQLREIEIIMGAHNLYMGRVAAMTGGGAALGVVAVYGQVLVRLYAAASLAIAVMDASDLEASVKSSMRTLACNAFKSIFAGMFGPWGEAFSALEYLIGTVGGQETNPPPCR